MSCRNSVWEALCVETGREKHESDDICRARILLLNIIFRSAVLIGRLRGTRRRANLYWRKDGRTILKSRKNMVFRNISKTTQYFFLIVSGPHRRLLKTYLGSFRIGKIGNFSTQKSSNIIFWKSRKKHAFQEYLKNYSIFFPDCFWSPQKTFEDIFWKFPNWKNRKFFHSKIA